MTCGIMWQMLYHTAPRLCTLCYLVPRMLLCPVYYVTYTDPYPQQCIGKQPIQINIYIEKATTTFLLHIVGLILANIELKLFAVIHNYFKRRKNI